MCTDDNKKKSCSEIAALCEEDLDADNGFKCICDDGYDRDKSKNGTCTHKCNLESNIEKCSPSLSFCELDGDYNSKCTCPPIYLEESTKSCNKLAEYFFIDTFQILKKPYEVFRDPETLTSFVDYTKLGKSFKEAFSSVFKFYKSSKVFNCKEKGEYLNCTVELQFTKSPGEELNLIFTPSVCLPMINSKYCLIPPRLIFRNRQHGVFKKTNICDDIASTSMCGLSTNCELSNSKRDFQCTCKQGFIPSGAYLPFPGNSESVIQTCLDVDECQDDGVCPESTYCVNSIGSYDCYCAKGFRQNIGVDIKIEGCLGICNPNPCKHGSCNLTGSDGFVCNCDPSYTGLKCDELNLLVTDIQSSSRKFSFIIGGTLGSALFVVVLICIILIWKNRKHAFKVEEEGKAYELRRRQWIESKRERLETRNGRKTGGNHETVSNIYTEQENSMQRQYRQKDSKTICPTNLQVYPQDYIQRAHAKGNMGISYQRSPSIMTFSIPMRSSIGKAKNQLMMLTKMKTMKRSKKNIP
ncbi:hypothetical protein JTE90_019998 [Oedothorax gibbosus]|uniref:EGF-like domain-containing protein n=1 Tax=Oedothorax gibbosus TaxID=931172 RepID=A0AAV6TPR7_9ARAC|nr:hypothetical protein JTE90_019998 [Oedothorax gibbosus]